MYRTIDDGSRVTTVQPLFLQGHGTLGALGSVRSQSRSSKKSRNVIQHTKHISIHFTGIYSDVSAGGSVRQTEQLTVLEAACCCAWNSADEEEDPLDLAAGGIIRDSRSSFSRFPFLVSSFATVIVLSSCSHVGTFSCWYGGVFLLTMRRGLHAELGDFVRSIKFAAMLKKKKYSTNDKTADTTPKLELEFFFSGWIILRACPGTYRRDRLNQTRLRYFFSMSWFAIKRELALSLSLLSLSIARSLTLSLSSLSIVGSLTFSSFSIARFLTLSLSLVLTRSLPLFTTLAISLSLALARTLSLSLAISYYRTLSRFLYLSLSLFHSISLSIARSRTFSSLSIARALSLYSYLSLSISLSLLHSHFLSLSHIITLPLAFYISRSHSFTLSLALALSRSITLALSLSLSLILSHSPSTFLTLSRFLSLSISLLYFPSQL